MKNPFSHSDKKHFFDLELGLSRKNDRNQKRIIEKDGRFNVKRVGISPFKIYNLYHILTTLHWFYFTLVLLASYLLVNTLFAASYLFIGIEGLLSDSTLSMSEQFWETFFFSSQTLTTVGYGRISPLGMAANWIAMIESMLGLLLFAILTGLLYGRFSKPNINIEYSHNAIIAPFNEGKALMFRLANVRRNQLIETEIKVVFSYIDPDNDSRKYHGLELNTSKINFFPLNWTIVHTIDEDSPLHDWEEKEFKNCDVEIMILVKGHDDIYNQTIHSRNSYRSQEILWGRRFLPMYYVDDEGRTMLELDKIDDIEKVKIT